MLRDSTTVVVVVHPRAMPLAMHGTHEKINSWVQPRPQGLLLDDFQNGGSTAEDPGQR